MPMHDTHLIIHESIDSFVDEVDGLVVPGCIDHDSTIEEFGLIVDFYGEVAHGAFCAFFVAGYGLKEGL